jgi:hypothetical protein
MLRCETVIFNEGTGSGLDVCLQVCTNYSSKLSPRDNFVRTDKPEKEGQANFWSPRALHPGERLRCFTGVVTCPVTLNQRLRGSLGVPDADKIVFDVGIFVKDCEPKRLKIKKSGRVEPDTS